MKITTYVEFQYILYIDIKTVQALRKVAAKHYDQRCRESGTLDGFMGEWERSLQWDIDNPVTSVVDPSVDLTPRVYAKWRDIDFCLKIMEQSTFQQRIKTITGDELVLLEALSVSFHKLFIKTSRMWKEWDKEINATNEYPETWEGAGWNECEDYYQPKQRLCEKPKGHEGVHGVYVPRRHDEN